MKKFAITALAASFLAAAPAAAEDFVVRINYGDLDLATPSGVELLGERIEASAGAACGRSFKGVASVQNCKDQVVAGALEQMSAKGVTLSNVG